MTEKSSSSGVGHGQVDAGLGRPDHERAGEQHGAVRPSSARGASASGRIQSRTRVRRPRRRSNWSATPQYDQQHDADAGHDQRLVAGQRGRRGGRRRPPPRGSPRARSRRACARATTVPSSSRLPASVRCDEQHDAQRLARARRQHVVAHVAHRGERVGVDAAGLDARQVEDPVPALAAQRAVASGVERRARRPSQANDAGAARAAAARPGSRPTTPPPRARPARPGLG